MGYVVARPALAAAFPDLTIAEFPAGLLVVGGLLYWAFRRGEPQAPPAPWRRHEQVVRELPDPAAERFEHALDRWVQSGENPDEAADILARATAQHAADRERLRAEIAQSLSEQGSRRKREAILERYANKQSKTGA